MGDGFSNSVAAGDGALVRPALKSPNFVAGTTGWQIAKDGSAEFNDVTVRGTIYIVDVDGRYIKIFDENPGSGSIIEFNPPNVVGRTWIPGRIYTDLYPTPNPSPILISQSPGEAGYNNAVVALISGGPDIAGSIAQLQADGIFMSGPVTLEGGMLVFTGDILLPDTSVIAYTPDGSTVETWHSLTLGAGWTGTARYKRLVSPDNMVVMQFQATPSTKADGTLIATLPAAYRPLAGCDLPVAVNSMSGATAQSPHFGLASNGELRCYGCTNAAGVGGVVYFPLD